ARLLVTRYVIIGAPREAARIIDEGLAGSVAPDLRTRATACARGGQSSQLALMRAVLADGSPDPELLTYCGMSLFMLRREPLERRKAMVLLDRAVELAPDDAEILNNVGYTYADAGVRLAEALALVSKANMLSPNRGHIVDSVGWAYFRKGMLREALTQLQRAVRMSPDSAEIQYHIGKLYRHLGRRGEAQRHLRAALRIDPNHRAARVELDLCLELPRPVYG
ncbi:MAG: tetratricopeptide repeat protein, partial [Armatimonadota bacterium]